ncbi:hypothetical protein [Pseudooceanicola sp. LIPI14-2-Ac024]|uniref:hypothetical protein n=1 Tax=Pseudooceanicola sp. LIPI14-2-Ac024 TaxID=3344875 RepID=UPI0035D0FA87
MNERIAAIRDRIHALEDELEGEYHRQRLLFHYHVESGRVRFDRAVLQRHRDMRQRLLAFITGAPLRHILTAPVIYSLIVPFALLDLWVSLYQAVCFPAYGIPMVKRSEFIRIDRHKLGYLNSIQKLNCVYCGYVNGLIAYVAEVAGRTEAYWCPIKHAMRVRGRHRHYAGFMDYGDADGYASGVEASRSRIQKVDARKD